MAVTISGCLEPWDEHGINVLLIVELADIESDNDSFSHHQVNDNVALFFFWRFKWGICHIMVKCSPSFYESDIHLGRSLYAFNQSSVMGIYIILNVPDSELVRKELIMNAGDFCCRVHSYFYNEVFIELFESILSCLYHSTKVFRNHKKTSEQFYVYAPVC